MQGLGMLILSFKSVIKAYIGFQFDDKYVSPNQGRLQKCLWGSATLEMLHIAPLTHQI